MTEWFTSDSPVSNQSSKLTPAFDTVKVWYRLGGQSCDVNIGKLILSDSGSSGETRFDVTLSPLPAMPYYLRVRAGAVLDVGPAVTIDEAGPVWAFYWLSQPFTGRYFSASFTYRIQ